MNADMIYFLASAALGAALCLLVMHYPHTK